MAVDSETLEMAVHNVAGEVAKVCRQSDWREYDERSLWFELVACILGSRARFEDAGAAALRLFDAGMLDKLLVKGDRQDLEGSVARILSLRSDSGVSGRYPFPRSRARYICYTAASIYGENGTLAAMLRESRDGRAARARLVNKCLGIGPKQASLFLRNVGYSPDLAILDTHVLRFMARTELIPGRLPTVSGMAGYERMEEVLGDYARRIGVTIGVLDIAIWVVMRIAQREFSL